MTSTKRLSWSTAALVFVGALAMMMMMVTTMTIPVASQSIMAVDPGTNFMKVVLVQPGKVFDIALSTDSKRKTFTGIGIVDGVRAFGSESFNVYGKKPQHTVWRVRELLGRSPTEPELVHMLERHHLTHNRLIEAADGTGAIRIEFAKGTKDANTFSPEELFAMILTHCKENAERHGSTKVSSVALTVPMYYNQARRQGLMDAVEVSGLSLLGLVDENGGAAISYAVDRSFNETATNVLIFNMGAAATQVSIVQITGGKDKRSGKEFRNIKVLAKAWDESLGIEDIDITLATHFAKEFDEKHPSPDNKIKDSPRAIVRLKKEARQIKEILSGLDKFPLSFQSLHRDIDFKSHLTRAQLEEFGKETLSRVRAPVERALKYAGMTVKDLHLVEVVGGGFRVPGIRNSLQQVVPAEMDLSTHVNGDEGMAFGAAFVAANVSSTFHVPRVATFQDAIPREVRLILKGDDLDRDVPLFSRFSQVEGKDLTKQVIKFRYNKDFTVQLIEKKAVDDDPTDAPESTVAMEFQISGMKGALAAFGKFGEPKVHLTFSMDRSMMLHLGSVEARFEEEYEEQVKAAANATSANKTENATATTEGGEAATPQTVKKVRKHAYVLLHERIDKNVPVKKMTTEAKLKAQALLKQMDENDKARARKDEARNALESFSFVSREKLDNNEQDVKLVMDAEALEALKSEIAQIEDWIDDHKQSTAEEFNEHRLKLSNNVDRIFLLIKEHQERPAAVSAYKSVIKALEDRRANWTQERPWITEKVWEVVDKAQEDAWKWIADMEEKQAKLTPKQEPVLSLASIRQEMEKIQKMVELLLKQRKPAPININPKKTESTKSAKKEGGEESKDSKADEKSSSGTDDQEGEDSTGGSEEAAKSDDQANEQATKPEAEKEEL